MLVYLPHNVNNHVKWSRLHSFRQIVLDWIRKQDPTLYAGYKKLALNIKTQITNKRVPKGITCKH